MKQSYTDLNFLVNNLLTESASIEDKLREIVNSLIVLNNASKNIDKRVTAIEKQIILDQY